MAKNPFRWRDSFSMACSPRPQFNKMAANLVNCTQYQTKKMDSMASTSSKSCCLQILNCEWIKSNVKFTCQQQILKYFITKDQNIWLIYLQWPFKIKQHFSHAEIVRRKKNIDYTNPALLCCVCNFTANIDKSQRTWQLSDEMFVDFSIIYR